MIYAPRETDLMVDAAPLSFTMIRAGKSHFMLDKNDSLLILGNSQVFSYVSLHPNSIDAASLEYFQNVFSKGKTISMSREPDEDFRPSQCPCWISCATPLKPCLEDIH